MPYEKNMIYCLVNDLFAVWLAKIERERGVCLFVLRFSGGKVKIGVKTSGNETFVQ